jgi:predicted transposase YdaD
MAGKWDSPLKRLVEDYPQDFVSWLLQQATFERVLKTELSHRIIHTDMLLEATKEGRRCALHLEFQAESDPHMAKRLWEYNVRATIQYGCPVYSYVVYLKKSLQSARSPYRVILPDGQEVHRFQFGVIELAETEPEDLRRVGAKALLPLLPLTRGGKRHEVVDVALAEFAPAGEVPNAELLVFTLEFASLVFSEESDREWLKRRFSVFNDILRETWVFQEIMQEGEEKGLKKGLEGLRQTLLSVVQARFPELVFLARGQVVFIEDMELLQNLIVNMSTAQTAEEAQHRLLEVGREATDR